MDRFHILPWDSEFFGMPIARIIPDRLTTGDLRETVARLRDNGIRLAYWPSDPDDEESQRAAQVCGGFFADRKVTYVTDLGQRTDAPDTVEQGVEEYDGCDTCDELERLAVQAGIYSRFKLDPRIPDEKFAELYRLWIRNSVNRKIADGVLVVRRSGSIVGMVTVAEKNRRGDIGLIAVDGSMRGKNLGVALVRAAQEWSRRRGFWIAQVVTQGENAAACRLYEKCGYTVEKVEHFYHFWI